MGGGTGEERVRAGARACMRACVRARERERALGGWVATGPTHPVAGALGRVQPERDASVGDVEGVGRICRWVVEAEGDTARFLSSASVPKATRAGC